MTTTPPNPPLRYGAMRLRWCGLALRAFIARWGVYVLVTGVVLSAGASGWDQVLQAIAAVLVLPLFSASAHGWLLLPATLAQAGLGAAAVWGARSLLWSRRWAESERALPLPRGETLRSDLLVVFLVSIPLLLLYVAGAVTLLAHRPAWLQPTRGRATAALALAAALSLGLGAALLQWQRTRVAHGAAGRPRDDGAVPAATVATDLSAWKTVILLPLWRGPARRTGVTVLWGSALLVLLPAVPGALRWAGGWPWVLAAWAAVALVTATRIHQLARLELTELIEACAALPVDLPTLRRARSALGLLPLLPALGAVLIGIVIAPPPGLRPAVLLAWATACALACIVEVCAEPRLASDKAARWWFSLVVCACVASEVLA